MNHWHQRMAAKRVAFRWKQAAARKLVVYDFDDTLVSSKAAVSVHKAGGESITMDSATFAHFKPVDGDKLDFGAFNDVVRPRKIKKNFDALRKNVEAGHRVVILTARPKGASSAVKKFMAAQGIDSLEVVALASSDPYDKARWIDKAIEDEGHDEVEFYDDSTANANAVGEHGKKHTAKGLKFLSENTPHPKEDDYDGAEDDKTFGSSDPTKALVEYKAKVPKAPSEEKAPDKPSSSSWWQEQTDKFKQNYCGEHPASGYCKAASVDSTKKRFSDAARRIGNPKVTAYMEELFDKLDQAGPAAGIWLEGLEHDWGSLSGKPQGLLKAFTAKDFKDLHKVLFGY
mgnify:CR=1 FL=1